MPFWQNPDFLLRAGFEVVKEICSADELCLNSEYELVKFLKKYIQFHQEHGVS